MCSLRASLQEGMMGSYGLSLSSAVSAHMLLRATPRWVTHFHSGCGCAHSCSPPAPRVPCSSGATVLSFFVFGHHPKDTSSTTSSSKTRRNKQKEERPLLGSVNDVWQADTFPHVHSCALQNHTHTHTCPTSPSPAALLDTHGSLWSCHHDSWLPEPGEWEDSGNGGDEGTGDPKKEIGKEEKAQKMKDKNKKISLHLLFN